LATHNERRFIASCIEHLHRHGVEVYLIDNCSTDDTVEIAASYEGHGVIGIESLPRDGIFSLRTQLERKEQLASEIDADWFMHLDADEVRLPPPGRATLTEALAEVDKEGYNAVNFLELSFIPTREEPDHDHPRFHDTLRTYYPLLPEFPHRLNAWKATVDLDLAWKGGHQVRFAGLRMWPRSFLMKHYLFLSVPHAVEKYVERRFDGDEVKSGWHRWRDGLTAADIRLPGRAEVRATRSDADLDSSNPSRYHYLTGRWTSPLDGQPEGRERR
jgi:glycosyltransferase involved in cell wall biosynthesis